MAVVAISDSILTDIADAIRAKNGTSNTYKPSQMPDAIEAISGGGVTPTGTKQISITQNGVTTEDVTNYADAEIDVNVPNSYSAGDEGKVVSNGTLAAQTSQNIDTNGTYDTTLKNEVVVNVGGGGGVSGNIANFLALVPAFDDTWSTTEFSILSYPSSGYIEVPHSLGEVPSYAVVLKTDITLSDMEGIIGGYNFIGGAKTDSALNRNLKFSTNSSAGTDYNQLAQVYGMGLGTIQNNNWNMVGSTCPNWTSEKITFRVQNGKNTNAGYCLGQYILGVKKVQ